MGKTYIITYDLPEGSDYEPLIKKIKEYGTWAHITQSTWAIVTESTSVEVRDALKPLIGKEGRLLVVQSAHVAAWSNVMCSNDWMKSNL